MHPKHPTGQSSRLNRLQRLLSALASSSAGLFLAFGLVTGLEGMSRLPATPAATITVTTTADELNLPPNEDGDCSLREAIQAANTDTPVDACGAGSGADTIYLSSGIYTLTIPGFQEDNNRTGDLDIWDTLTLNGADRAATIINANQLDMALNVQAWASTPLTLTNLTIHNGTRGLLANGQTVVANTTFMSNTANGHGGGAYFARAVTMTNTTFISNTATASGGGAFFGGAATVTGANFVNNRAGTGGGAMFSIASAALVTVTNTAFVSNTAVQGGGILFASVGTGAFTNVLLAANSATNGGGAALFVQAVGSTTTATLRHVTIASPTLGSGSAVYVASGSVNITDTLIASYPIGLRRTGGTVNENYNLFSGVNTPYSGTVNIGPNSLTGPAAFADTTSYKLSSASAAVDAGVDVGVTTDFEGDPRPLGAGFDIGWDERGGAGAGLKLYLPLILRGAGAVRD